MKWILDILRGMVIGLANVIPGILSNACHRIGDGDACEASVSFVFASR